MDNGSLIILIFPTQFPRVDILHQARNLRHDLPSVLKVSCQDNGLGDAVAALEARGA